MSSLQEQSFHHLETIQTISTLFGLHALVAEDIVNSDQRPKIEDYEEYLFIVLKILCFDEKTGQFRPEQISMVVGSNYVITFRESNNEILSPILNRLRNNRGRIRKLGADYLAYAIFDLIIDLYFTALDQLGTAIEKIEEELITHPSQDTLHKIHALNREVLLFRRTAWPFREIINTLMKGDLTHIQESTFLFLRDLQDHILHVIETGETFREVITDLLNLYMSQISNRLNEIMKVLTIFAAIFIPLTFIAGVYGMNFEYMPELHKPWGYPLVLLIMATMSGFMLYYFRKKRWI